jgi:2-oxoglutarate ferredoxin oxidoreductase subunit delta
MSRVELREERCKGCMLCTTVCPQGLLDLSSRFNTQGFNVVQVDAENAEECKGCAFCAEICPDHVITVFRSKRRKDEERTHAS